MTQTLDDNTEQMENFDSAATENEDEMTEGWLAFWWNTMVSWLRNRSVEQWGYAAVFLLGAFLRFWQLGAKPLHHDESLHAYFSLMFLENPSSYVYDPLLHGPFQFHIIPIFYILGKILGLPGNGANDFTVRILPALMGTGMLLIPWLLREPLGKWGAFAMAVLLAVSPSFVYYSRFVRDDIYVACFTLLTAAAVIQYTQTRQTRWLLISIASIVLSYTAMENTLFVIGIFGAYLIALLIWDLGEFLGKTVFSRYFAPRDQSLAGRILTIGPFALLMAGLGLIGLKSLSSLSATINQLAAAHTGATDPLNPDVTIQRYESFAVILLVLVSLAVCIGSIGMLIINFQNQQDPFTPSQNTRLRRIFNPQNYPVVSAMLNISWMQWFLMYVTAWICFVAFFWVIPANIYSFSAWGQGFTTGVGKGMLQGVYYWLEQQHVARGGQPWYYYLVLIPLYEQAILVFGLAGLVMSLIKPNKFRLFLVWWFIATLILYSWAGEKMPWLVVHILLPLAALAGVAINWLAVTVISGVKKWWKPSKALLFASGVAILLALASESVASVMAFAVWLSLAAIVCISAAIIIEQYYRKRITQSVFQGKPAPKLLSERKVLAFKNIVAATGLVLLGILLIPTIWNMAQVSFVEPAMAPNEMLIYVQTTPSVLATMQKIAELDRIVNHGKQLYTISIGVTPGAVWPFAWYLHQYTNVIYNYSPTMNGAKPDIILAGLNGSGQAILTNDAQIYTGKQYPLRWWWDESYKLPQCSAVKTSQCSETSAWPTGVGPFLWISYGAYPPQPACHTLNDPKCSALNDSFSGSAAAQRFWNWLWLRQNISGTQPGSTDYMFFVTKALASKVAP